MKVNLVVTTKRGRSGYRASVTDAGSLAEVLRDVAALISSTWTKAEEARKKEVTK